MAKPNETVSEQLTKFISMRISTEDDELLTRVAERYPLAKRGAVARKALRMGLEALNALDEH